MIPGRNIGIFDLLHLTLEEEGINRGIQYYGFQKIYSSPVLEQTEEIEDRLKKIRVCRCDTLRREEIP